MKHLIIYFIMILGFIILLSLWGFYLAICPPKMISQMTPHHLGVHYDHITLKTKDNITIDGWFIPSAIPSSKAIILLHGYPADKGDILPSRFFLHQKYNLLLIDFRYFGKSSGRYTTVGQNEILDVFAAVEFLHQKNIQDVGIWGFSLGGAVAIMAASKTSDIKAIVAEASYARLDQIAYQYFNIPLLRYPMGVLLRLWAWLFLGVDLETVAPVESAVQLKIPILIIHSKTDHVIGFEHAQLFKDKLKHAPNVQFVFSDDLLHGTSTNTIQQTIEQFFDKNL